jgi:hypothetical protein
LNFHETTRRERDRADGDSPADRRVAAIPAEKNRLLAEF